MIVGLISRLFRIPYRGEKCGECVGKNIPYRGKVSHTVGKSVGNVWKRLKFSNTIYTSAFNPI